MRYTPLLSATDEARGPVCLVSVIKPNSFFIHSMVEPHDTITPSNAYCTVSSVLQQIVVTIPFLDSLGCNPVFFNIEQPVPNVALAVPGVKQPSPNAAACESPINPVISIVKGNKPLRSV